MVFTSSQSLRRVHVPQPLESKARSVALISIAIRLESVDPFAVVADGPPSRPPSLAQEHPSDESEFCQSPGAISSPTSHVPLLNVPLPGAAGVGAEDAAATAGVVLDAEGMNEGEACGAVVALKSNTDGLLPLFKATAMAITANPRPMAQAASSDSDAIRGLLDLRAGAAVWLPVSKPGLRLCAPDFLLRASYSARLWGSPRTSIALFRSRIR